MRSRLPSLVLALLLILPLLSLSPTVAEAGSRFSDGDQTVHTDAIEAIAQVGVASGYPDGTYRPGQAVSRDQMATFLMRGLRLTEFDHDFEDVDRNSTHSSAIGAIANVQVTQGCAPGRYCPREPVTRAQMATFLKRALALPDDTGRSFRDVDPEDVHAPGIRAVAAAGITLGCGDGSRYCPTNPVQRDQMAAFLDRALGLDGPVPCPDVSGSVAPASIGSAVYGFGVSTAVRTDGRLELLSMDLAESRAARVPFSGSTDVTGTATIPRGTRTWASVASDDHVFVGQDTDGVNLYRFPSADDDERPVTQIARVPYGGEFWALALDEDRDRLWAGTRGHREEELASDDEHVVYRIEDVSGSGSEPEPVAFHHDDLPLDSDRRPDVKQLHWEAGTETLFLGLGGSATFEGAARLYALTDLDAEDGPAVEDLTPPEVAQDGLEIFSMDVTDTHLAIGTRSETRAQIAVRERDDDQWILSTLPDGERRVDRVALGVDRLVAGSFPSGTIWELDLLTGDRTELGSAGGAANQPVRFLEIDGDTVRGVTSQGLVWTQADGSWSNTTFTDRRGSVGLTAPGLAHSLTVTRDHVVAGANNSLQVRATTTPSKRRVVAIGGEAKALATDGRSVWAATYPGAALWRIDPANGEAEQVGSWDGRYQRPRDATYNSFRHRVLVVARTDPAFASGLFQMSTGPGSQITAVRVTDGSPDLESWQQRNVQSTAVATQGDVAYVGTYGAGVPGESGGVVAYDLTRMRKLWYARPARGEVVSLEVVGDRLVGAAQTNSSGGGNTWFELDPDDGRTLAAGNDETRLGHGPMGDAVSVGPVTIGAMGRAVTGIQRGADRATTLASHEAHETFGGPFIDLDGRGGRCDLYAIQRREILRMPYDPATRLDH